MERQVVENTETLPTQHTNNIYNFERSDGINLLPECKKLKLSNNYSPQLHIHTGNIEKKAHPLNASTPIERVKQPVLNFQKTLLFSKIYQNISTKSTVILHCHGFSGSGKSQNVLKLAEDFPFTNSGQQLYLKWHIECDNKNHDIKEELKELVVQMQQQLNLNLNYELILNDLNKGITVSLVKAFHRSCIPVLIIIELANINSQCQPTIINDLLRSVEHLHNTDVSKVHIYLTSQSKSSFLSDEERSNMKCYQMESIIGFSRKEGIDFLLSETKQKKHTEINAAGKVYERFSGSPLGLQVAKAYCIKTLIDYCDYMQLIEEQNEETIQADEEVIAKQFGPKAQHVFQAITMPFRNDMQNESINNEDKLLWKVLSCLSYFHHNQIPRFLVESCFEYLRDTDCGKSVKLRNKLDSGKLITRLSDYAMCTLQEIDHIEFITFHQVVLHAFRTCQETGSDKKFDHLIDALWVMTGLLKKDLRFKETLTRMNSLISHLQVLLYHVDEKDKLWEDKNDVMIRIGIVHLYEMVGAISMRNFIYKKYSDQYFKRAVELIWDHKNLYSLSDPAKREDNVNKVADCVLTQCDLEANQLPSNFITEFQSKTLAIPIGEQLEAIKNCSTDAVKFQKVLQAFKLHNNKKEIIKLLRECNVYLDEESHKKVFFVERIASLLHSWSRVVLYKNESNDDIVYDYLWMSSLSFAISVKCQEKHGIKLFSEFLSVFTGKIQIISQLKCRSSEALNEAKDICEERLNTREEAGSSKSYEYGWLITPHTCSCSENRMRIIRNLIPIYTNILNLPNQNSISQGDKYCEELLSFASEQIGKSSNALMWVIQCAKFYSSSKNIDQAMSCYDKYFEMKELNAISFQSHPWAIYNFAKIVLAENKLEFLSRAVDKISDLFDSQQVIENELHHKLCRVMDRLQQQKSTMQ